MGILQDSPCNFPSKPDFVISAAAEGDKKDVASKRQNKRAFKVQLSNRATRFMNGLIHVVDIYFFRFIL